MPKAKKIPHSRHDIRQRFRYDPETGTLSWRKGPRAGKNAARVYTYVISRVSIDDEKFTASHLIWKYMTGRDPVGVIDHINRDPTDHRWENLRETNQRANALNASYRPNAAGRRGIRQLPSGNWQAYTSHRFGPGRRYFKSLGTYPSKKDAIAARAAYERSHIGAEAPE